MSYIKMYDSFTDGFDKRSKASLRILMILIVTGKQIGRAHV